MPTTTPPPTRWERLWTWTKPARTHAPAPPPEPADKAPYASYEECVLAAELRGRTIKIMLPGLETGYATLAGLFSDRTTVSTVPDALVLFGGATEEGNDANHIGVAWIGGESDRVESVRDGLYRVVVLSEKVLGRSPAVVTSELVRTGVLLAGDRLAAGIPWQRTLRQNADGHLEIVPLEAPPLAPPDDEDDDLGYMEAAILETIALTREQIELLKLRCLRTRGPEPRRVFKCRCVGGHPGCRGVSLRPCGRTEALAEEGAPAGVTVEQAERLGWVFVSVWPGMGWYCPMCARVEDAG